MISVHGLTKRYALGSTVITAIDNVSLDIRTGEFLAVGGSSGSGKSTLLNIIGCLDRPDKGTVVIDGQRTDQLSEKRLNSVRLNNIGFIFQAFNLISSLTVYENIELPLLIRKDVSADERRTRVNTFIEKVGLADRRRNKAHELSGGQRQRVAVARALATRPGLVLADEPTANLDSHTGIEVINLMHQISRDENTTFIFSTHDPKVMNRADRLVRLEDGRIIEIVDNSGRDVSIIDKIDSAGKYTG